MSWRERVLSILRVPHEPEPPFGDEDVRVFRAAPGYMHYLVARWALTNLGALVGVIAALRFSQVLSRIVDNITREAFGFNGGPAAVMIFEAFAIALFLVQAVGSLLLLRLDIEQRWYIVSDRSIRIREGLVRLHEKTMTLANVQQVSVQQGPLQRLLGIADVQVRSAGGGGGAKDRPGESGEELHVAYFRGVADAELITEAVRERMRAAKDAGLGDPDDAPQSTAPSLLDSAHELIGEARLLRRAVTGVSGQTVAPGLPEAAPTSPSRS